MRCKRISFAIRSLISLITVQLFAAHYFDGRLFDSKLNDGDVNYLELLSITNRTKVVERYRCTALLQYSILSSFYRGVLADTAKNETEQPVLGDEPNARTDMRIKLHLCMLWFRCVHVYSRGKADVLYCMSVCAGEWIYSCTFASILYCFEKLQKIEDYILSRRSCMQQQLHRRASSPHTYNGTPLYLYKWYSAAPQFNLKRKRTRCTSDFVISRFVIF